MEQMEPVYLFSHNQGQSARAECDAELARLVESVSSITERKRAFRCMRDFKSTQEMSEALKTVQDKIARLKRSLEPVIMSCPFCLWDGATLFDTS